jgi:hypothetical protein
MLKECNNNNFERRTGPQPLLVHEALWRQGGLDGAKLHEDA